MARHNFFELVKHALPDDLSPDELMEYAPLRWWRERPRLASAYALRKCPRINWQAYKERYPDIKGAGIDPCLHFLLDGIYEGRKLVSWHPLKEPEQSGQPLVSVLIANFNNELYLGKCLESVIGQSLHNIEIIVVDDGSRDGSPALIQRYMASEPRLKCILSSSNCGIFMARKKAVAMASGKYVMFLDSDDYLAQNACEIAYSAIIRGYDMVKFGAHVRNMGKKPPAEIGACDKLINGGKFKEYGKNELPRAIFANRELPWNIWSKIYLREICVAAYNSVRDGKYNGAEDMLSAVSFLNFGRSMFAIEDKLIFYNYGCGVSTSYDKKLMADYMANTCVTQKTILEYAKKYNINIDVSKYHEKFCSDAIFRLINHISEDQFWPCFNFVSDIFGLHSAMDALIDLTLNKIKFLARRIISQTNEINGHIRRIGIYYPHFSIGGIEVVIKSLCEIMQDEKLSITIFTVTKTDQDVSLPDFVKLIYVKPLASDPVNLKAHSRSLQEALKSNPVDVVLYIDTYSPKLVYDIILFHYHGIPVILNHHGNFALPFMRRFGVPYKDRDAVFAAADAVTCLSIPTELYMRRQGINAWYIHNPVWEVRWEPRQHPPKNIAVIARMSEPNKQIGQALLVLREIAKTSPWMKAYFIGDFASVNDRDEFYARVSQLELEQQVILTGWTTDPNYFLRQCGVLLSTSYWESFHMGIAEAQSLGLPCVIYDIPIEQAKDNESIVVVPQGEYEAAACAVLAILENEAEWRRLSRIAAAKAKRYNPESFKRKMAELLENFQRYSPYRAYTRQDYETVITYGSFYSGRRKPEKWSD